MASCDHNSEGSTPSENFIKDIVVGIRTVGLGNALMAAQHRYRKAWAEAQWENPQRPRKGLARWYAFRRRLSSPGSSWPLPWQAPGAVQTFTSIPRGILVQAEHASIEIIFFAPDLVRVRYLPSEGTPPRAPVPYAIAKPLEEWPETPFTTLTTPQTFFVCTGVLTVGINMEDASLFFADPAGRLLGADIDAGWNIQGSVRHRTALAADEHLFGLGERATPWNRRGRRHTLWNTDIGGYQNDDDPLNLNIPVYISLRSAPTEDETGDTTLSHLIFYENPTYAEFDLGATTPEIAEHTFQGGELRYYFAVGPVPHLVERYTELTGRHGLPPLWMLGYQQSRWSYMSAAKVRQVAQEFRERDIPCDAIHLDIHYMEGYRLFTWDRQCFPSPSQLVEDLRALGIKLITIIDAGVKKDFAYPVYRSGLEGNHFCKLPHSKVWHAPVWPGLCAFPDFTSSRTRKWWGEQHAPLVKAGVAGFWDDMNEPAAFTHGGDPTLPHPIQHDLEGRGGDHREAHNIYGMQMARASQEGIRELAPEKRPVVITRSGWAGIQRYATSWTGDNESTWEAMRLAMPMVLGLGLSGVGFTGPDTGGFNGAPTGELFTRWIEMSTFMPFFRAHTALNTPDQEPWSYGEPYLSINRRFIQLRYELLPYLYTAVWQMATKGWPMVRPLWWHDPEDAILWEIDDAFLCGDALLVAPVGSPGTTDREVRLPRGSWYDFWTNRIRQGNELFSQFAPLETIPLFVRAGTVLPLGEIGPSVEQRSDKFLRLHLYPLTQEGEAKSYLYQDAGEGMGYLEGEQRVDTFTLRREKDRLLITWGHEGNYTPPYHHVALTLNGLRRMPQAVIADGEAYSVVVADKVLHTALLGVPPFKVLEVQL